MVKLGFHVSISGGIDKSVDRAIELGCDTFQIFTRNPRSWISRELIEGEITAFKVKKEKSGVEDVFAHTPYILNLASPKEDIYRRSVDSLSLELKRCRKLGVSMLVTHIGSHLGTGLKKGITRVADALNLVLDENKSNVRVLLEMSSGSRNMVGSTFEEIKLIIEGAHKKELVGVCFDTCHAFVAGHELRTPEGLGKTLDDFGDTIGLKYLKLVHLNDSVEGFGSRIDRHEHIGLGKIGVIGFELILKSYLSEFPMIMETPVDNRRSDEENINMVREIALTEERFSGTNSSLK